jgi:two-component system, NarL family, response regulator NreC
MNKIPIKIIVADDHKLFREGLVKLLDSAPNIEVIAEAENGQDVIIKAKENKSNIILMDIGMPLLNGIEATISLSKSNPEIKIIALSMHTEKEYIKDILDAGAAGYILKSCTYEELIRAIISIHEGKKYLSEEVTEIVLKDYLENKDNLKGDHSGLSKREFEILTLFAEGKSSREIAEQLFISIKTVGTHKQHILKKLNLKTNTDMVKYAIKEGIINL